MITANSKDQKAIFPAAKQEAPLPAPARQWSSAGFRNPRIVRVSRTFGGKDRHSKVCTVRGLRDRRIRLSVPTAVQLYELQDRLGLGQPSKVIDWLIDNTKADIDKLPPLQFPHGSLMGQFHHDPAPPVTAKPSEQESFFSQKLFGVSSYANYFHGTDNSPSLSLSHQLGLGQFALPHVDFSSDLASAASSSTLNSQLFLRAQPTATASLFGNFPQFENRHQMNHEHHASSSSSSSLFTSLTQHSHASLPNYTLMSSLQQNPSSTADHSPPNSIKSFPAAIFNPRLFAQSGFENRSGKDHHHD